jgi:hypothetical protein
MANDFAFAAAIPEPFQILGLRLKPMSLGRYRILRRVDCAFVAEESRVVSFGDLILGVCLCSMTCAAAAAWLDSKHCLRDIRRWSRRISPAPWLRRLPWIGRWWEARTSFNPLEKIKLFQRYISEASALPEYWDESDGRASGASHWSESMEVGLRSQLGWSKEEVEEQPLQKAIRDFFQLLEGSGAIRMLADGELESGKANAAAFAKALDAPAGGRPPTGPA